MQPETRYARLGRDRIAYQVIGQGPPDLVLTAGSFSHVDMPWEDAGLALHFRTLASFCRLIRFDRLGTGASDPLPLDALPPWESYAEELVAVLDEVGSQQAAVMAYWHAGPMAAAAQPDEILASSTVRDLVVGSDIALQDRGPHSLKGIEGSWRLFAVVRG